MDLGHSQTESDIRDFGCHVIMVLEDNQGPAFAYSIGFQERFNHPEVLILGLPHELMHQMINEMAERIKAGARFAAGQHHPDLLSDYDCLFVEVEKKYFDDYVGQALDYYRKRPFGVLQCLWPDKRHLFPPDAGFPEELRWKQNLDRTPEPGRGDWPFADAQNTATFTTRRVLHDHYPVLLVTHDEDGSWQILCGTTNSSQDAAIICLHNAYEMDTSIGDLANLPLGWEARRDSKDSPWQLRKAG